MQGCLGVVSKVPAGQSRNQTIDDKFQHEGVTCGAEDFSHKGAKIAKKTIDYHILAMRITAGDREPVSRLSSLCR